MKTGCSFQEINSWFRSNLSQEKITSLPSILRRWGWGEAMDRRAEITFPPQHIYGNCHKQNIQIMRFQRMNLLMIIRLNCLENLIQAW